MSDNYLGVKQLWDNGVEYDFCRGGAFSQAYWHEHAHVRVHTHRFSISKIITLWFRAIAITKCAFKLPCSANNELPISKEVDSSLGTMHVI